MNRCEIFNEYFNVPPSEQEYGVHVVADDGSPQKPILRHASLDEATAMMTSWSANSDGDTADCPELGFYIDYGCGDIPTPDEVNQFYGIE